MFNFPSDFGVPGFRVSQPDDPPGFRMNENSLSPTPDRGYVLVSGDSPAQDPLRQAVDRANVRSPAARPRRIRCNKRWTERPTFTPIVETRPPRL